MDNQQSAKQIKNNGLAIAGFVISIVSIIVLIWTFRVEASYETSFIIRSPIQQALPWLFVSGLFLAGFVMSSVAFQQIKRTKEQGRGLAFAGLCISGIPMFCFLLLLAVALIAGSG